MAGSMYALIVAGLALTVGVLRVVNFAHGDLFMVGGFVFYFIFGLLGIPYLPAALLTILAMVGIGAIFERIVIRPVVGKTWEVQLVATLAASTAINNGAIWLLGSMPKMTPTLLSSTGVKVFGFGLSWQRILIIVVTGLTFLCLHLFLTRTRTGKAMRAVSQNREAAEGVGIDIKGIALITFMISSGLIGLAAALVTPVFSVFPSMGTMLTLKAFAVLTVGGFGRVNGAIVAAIALGIVEALAIGLIGSSFTDGFAFIAMIVALLFFPYGIFGKRVGI